MSMLQYCENYKAIINVKIIVFSLFVNMSRVVILFFRMNCLKLLKAFRTKPIIL